MSTFTTERLKQLTAYAIKGAGFDKNFELSGYLGIQAENGIFSLNTTDGTNYLSVSDECLADDMDITVNAELFTKLISKITSDTIDMTVEGNALIVKGNGTYKLEIIPDTKGENLSFPNVFPDKAELLTKISATDLVAINTTVQASLDRPNDSVYHNYYFGDIVAGTDKKMVSVFNRKILDTPMLFNPSFIDLMCLSGSDATLLKTSDKIVSQSSINEKCSIYICTRIQDDLAGFNIEGINKFTNIGVKSFCRIRKTEMLDLLDRLILFVETFDDGAIVLHFTNEYVEVSSISSNSTERINYTESKDTEDITIKINIERLRNQLKSYNSDIVDLYYGNEVCIKLVDGDMTQVIALVV